MKSNIVDVMLVEFTNSVLLNDYIILTSFDHDGRGDKHHILPKSLFPEYASDRDNIVTLSVQDHIKAHELLVHLVKTQRAKHKMVCALNFVMKGLKYRTPEFLELMSIYNTGELNPMYGIRGKDNPNYGKPFSAERLRNLSKSLTGERHPYYGKKRPLEACANISKGLTGLKKTDEHCTNISKAKSGKPFKNWGGVDKEATKSKISAGVSGHNNGGYGKVRSSNPNAKAVVINNETYLCMLDAAEHFSVNKMTIYRWLKLGKATYAKLLDTANETSDNTENNQGT